MAEEIRRKTRDGSSSKEVEDDFSLESEEKKAKGKMDRGAEGRNKMELMKIKCFHCHEHGHYAKNYPWKKESKKESRVAGTS